MSPATIGSAAADQVDADNRIQQQLRLGELGRSWLDQLVAICQEILGELTQAMHQRVPTSRGGPKQHFFAGFVDDDVIGLGMKVAGHPDRLIPTIAKFGFSHKFLNHHYFNKQESHCEHEAQQALILPIPKVQIPAEPLLSSAELKCRIQGRHPGCVVRKIR